MGLGFVLLIWGIVGIILACIGSVAFYAAASFLTRSAGEDRRKPIVFASIFPFACLLWAGVVFVFQAIINCAILQRDPGIGDGFDCPLPNGFAISMTDVTEYGEIYNPKTRLRENDPDAVGPVRKLQLIGPYIICGTDSQIDTNMFGDHVDGYFVLDTKSATKRKLADYSAAQSLASSLGTKLHLEPINDVYSRYRFTWFDVFAACLLVAPPLVVFCVWLRSIQQVRKRAKDSPSEIKNLL